MTIGFGDTLRVEKLLSSLPTDFSKEELTELKLCEVAGVTFGSCQLPIGSLRLPTLERLAALNLTTAHNCWLCGRDDQNDSTKHIFSDCKMARDVCEIVQSLLNIQFKYMDQWTPWAMAQGRRGGQSSELSDFEGQYGELLVGLMESME